MRRRPVIGVFGMEEAPENLVSQLGELGLQARELDDLGGRELSGIDILHVFYPPMAWRGFILARLRGIRTIAHWIGTDVERCALDPGQRKRLTLTRPFIDRHLAVHGPLVEELARTQGLRALYQPNLSVHLTPEPLPWPDEPAVLCYVPPVAPELYGVPRLLRLARELPEVRFLACGSSEPPPDTPPNWEHLGLHDEMRPLYARARVLLRPTRRDGLARMVLEALGYERRVVWSQPFPHTLLATTEAELRRALVEALESGPNPAGRRMIERHFNRRRHAARLLDLYARLLGRAPVEFLAG